MKPDLRKSISRIKAPVTLALVALVFLLQGLAASPVLHLDVHDDANAEDHTCVVTTIANGHVDIGDPGCVLQLPLLFIAGVQLHAAFVHELLFLSADSNRGPPSLA